MRKLLLLTISILTGVAGFAQRTGIHQYLPINSATTTSYIFPHSTTARTTSVGDSIALSNIPSGDPIVVYHAGTGDTQGYLTGTDVWEDQAFAERYDFNGGDSSMKVVGILAQFGGVVNPASTHTLSFSIWDVGAGNVVSGSISTTGFPNNLLDSVTVPFTQIDASGALKAYMFDSASPTLQSSFFAGYSMSYNFTSLDGDTIGVGSSFNGARTSVPYTPYLYVTDLGDTTRDTVINVQNATMESDNTWYDNYTQNDSLYNDLAIFPIVKIGGPTSVGITKKNLTFFGNYPNPATDQTNIRFSLAAGTDVTIQVMDMTGKTLKIITQNKLAAGEHIIPVDISGFAAGNYLYLVHTADGAGVASELTVLK